MLVISHKENTVYSGHWKAARRARRWVLHLPGAAHFNRVLVSGQNSRQGCKLSYGAQPHISAEPAAVLPLELLR